MVRTLCFVRLPYSLSCLLLVGSLASNAWAGPITMNVVHEFPNAPSPQVATWQLRTASDETVSWTIPMTGPKPAYQVRLNGNDTGEFPNAITPAQAGIDWNAWAAAILNPAFDRSLLTFNGTTTEIPWPSVRKSFEGVDRIQLLVVDWPYGSTNPNATAVFQGGAVDEAIVPEPSAFVLLLGCLHGLLMRSRRNLGAVNNH